MESLVAVESLVEPQSQRLDLPTKPLLVIGPRAEADESAPADAVLGHSQELLDDRSILCRADLSELSSKNEGLRLRHVQARVQQQLQH